MKKKIFYQYKLNNFISINEVVSMHTRSDDADYFYPGESHNFWEIVYVIDGNLLFTLDDADSFELKKNNLLLIAPNVYHKHRCNGVHSTYSIMSFYCKNKIMQVFKNKILPATMEVKKVITDIQFESSHTFLTGTSIGYVSPMALVDKPLIGGEQMIRIYLEKLLIILFRNLNPTHEEFVYTKHEQLEKEIVKNTISFLENNLYENITINDLQKNLGYSKAYICNFFKKYTGDTIMKYFTKLKIDKAKEMLKTSEKSINQISSELNFDSPQHFAVLFKRIVSLTPSQYRKNDIN